MSDIIFYDDEHENYFFGFLKMFEQHCKKLDIYRYSAAYLLALDTELRVHYSDVFDFKQQAIMPEGAFEHAWQTGTSRRTTHLMFNLWNGYCADGEPADTAKPSYYCSPEYIFCCGYAPYYWQAIKLRFPEYTEE